jgi:acyl-CoA synthetase (AMP-forming)/AMP-acid ligase II
LGYSTADFGLEQSSLGGEIVTEGIKRRCQALFGPVAFSEGYGITETWPFGGTLCEQSHLHFEPAHGLLEVIDPETGRTAAPGEVGTLVLTPFAPFRDSVVLLRYDTQDLVRQLAEPPTCSQRHLPGTSNLLGKKRLAVRHAASWTTPRDILEAIESIDALPLPARCGFWLEGKGVAVEVVAPHILRASIGDALEARQVPLQALHLVDDLRELKRPLPWRGDLHESSFDVRQAALG